MTSVEMTVPGLGKDSLLARRVEGEPIFDLLQELELIAAHEEIKIPVNSQGAVDPRTNLVRNHELVTNAPLLEPVDITDNDFVPTLIERVPRLAEPIEPARITSVGWNENQRKGKTYVSLGFGEITRNKLMTEQSDIWYELPDMADNADNQHLLEWAPFRPGILILALGPSVPKSVPELIGKHVKRRLPIEVTLLPVGEPREARNLPEAA